MNCGVYSQQVPAERAVHNMEHGAVWITYSPSLPASQVSQLRALFARQTLLNPSGQGGSRYIDLTPYPGLPSPIVASSWGFQLRLTSPGDPRLQQFINKFRVSQQYTPEYGAECTGGVGTRSSSNRPPSRPRQGCSNRSARWGGRGREAAGGHGCAGRSGTTGRTPADRAAAAARRRCRGAASSPPARAPARGHGSTLTQPEAGPGARLRP